MAEEFQESEVIFQENTGNENNDHWYNFQSQLKGKKKNNELEAKKKKKREKDSIPMKIPENLSRNSWFQYKESDLFNNGYCYGDGEMVPPHVIVAQRVGRKMASSVCTGNGRTLKGRDLSEVRNSILRMTGFLET